MVQKCLVRIAASVARDGEAPESRQDASLREKQYVRGTSCTKLDKWLGSTKTACSGKSDTNLAHSAQHFAAAILLIMHVLLRGELSELNV